MSAAKTATKTKRKPQREFVTAAGRQNEVVQKLAQAVYARGGGDACLLKLLSDEQLRDEVAKLLVGEDGRVDLAYMLEMADFDKIDEGITVRRFPVSAERYAKGHGVQVDIGCGVTTEAFLKRHERAGVIPATLDDLLAYAAANPDAQRDHGIVAFGSSFTDRKRNRWCPCLSGNEHIRDLDLVTVSSNHVWHEDFRALMVYKSDL